MSLPKKNLLFVAFLLIAWMCPALVWLRSVLRCMPNNLQVSFTLYLPVGLTLGCSVTIRYHAIKFLIRSSTALSAKMIATMPNTV